MATVVAVDPAPIFCAVNSVPYWINGLGTRATMLREPSVVIGAPRSVKKTWCAPLPAPVPIWLAAMRGSPRSQADAPTAPAFAAVDV